MRPAASPVSVSQARLPSRAAASGFSINDPFDRILEPTTRVNDGETVLTWTMTIHLECPRQRLRHRGIAPGSIVRPYPMMIRPTPA